MEDNHDIVFGVKLVVQRGQKTYVPPNILDMYEVLEEIIAIDPKDIVTVQQYGPDPTRIDITMASEAAWKAYDIEAHLGNAYVLRS